MRSLNRGSFRASPTHKFKLDRALAILAGIAAVAIIQFSLIGALIAGAVVGINFVIANPATAAGVVGIALAAVLAVGVLSCAYGSLSSNK